MEFLVTSLTRFSLGNITIPERLTGFMKKENYFSQDILHLNNPGKGVEAVIHVAWSSFHSGMVREQAVNLAPKPGAVDG